MGDILRVMMHINPSNNDNDAKLTTKTETIDQIVDNNNNIKHPCTIHSFPALFCNYTLQYQTGANKQTSLLVFQP